MQTMGVFLRRYGFDLVLGVVILEGVFEVTSADAEVGVSVPQWVIVSGMVAIVLPLFARRWFPFMAPAMVWLIGAGISFVEGRLAVTTFSVYVTGVIAAYLLGNLPEPARARTGLIVLLIGAAVVVYNDPSRATSDFVTIPATFAIAWLAGFALRARADRIDEAEQRAIAAERDRECAYRGG